MQISHEEARKWMHLHLDGALNIYQKRLLNSHLDGCVECRAYADSIKRMESVLRPMLQRQWNQQPIPFPIGGLVSKGYPRTSEGMLLATRIAAIGMMFVVFLFGGWRLTNPSLGALSPALANVPSMPIPSTAIRSTSTQTGCGGIPYIVQKSDTLADIASRFSISLEELIQANGLTSNTMITGQQLVIPVCTSTPTVTLDAETTTYTPVLGRTTSTPGG